MPQTQWNPALGRGAPHFVYEENEVQKDETTCSKSHSQKLAHGIQTQVHLTVKPMLLSKIKKPENLSVGSGFATVFLFRFVVLSLL